MYHKPVLGLSEAQAAIQVMIEEAAKEPDKRPMSFVIVNDSSEVICSARMDGAIDFNTWMALKKAWSAARMSRNTRAIEDRLRPYNKTPIEAFGPEICALPGGNIITDPASGACIGAVGTSGRVLDEDEAMAQKGVDCIEEILKSAK